MERVEAYQDGVAGVKQSLSAMVYRIRTDRTKQSVKSWAQTVLGAAGLDGRDHPSVRQQAQALLDALRARTRYWPDPTGVEYVGTAEATLCLAPGNCTNGGDCDDLTVAFCSAAASVDIPCAIIHQKFGAGQQEHVLAAVQDERGRWLYADPTLKDAPVGERAPGVTWEQRIDPFEAVSFAGIAEATPSIVTFGRAPSGDTMMKFHNGHWWAWNGQEWLLHRGNGKWAGVGRIVYADFVRSELTRVQALWLSVQKDVDGCAGFGEPDTRAFYLQFNAWSIFYSAHQDIGELEFGMGSIVDQIEVFEKQAYDWQLKVQAANCKVSAPIIKPIPEAEKPLPEALQQATSAVNTALKAGAVIVVGAAVIYGLSLAVPAIREGRGLLAARKATPRPA